MEYEQKNLWGLIAFIGAILLIAGACMTWVDVDFNAATLSHSDSYSGLDVYDDDDDLFDDMDYGYAAVIVLTMGILALFSTLIPMFYKDEKVWLWTGAASFLFGLIALIFACLFNGDIPDDTMLLSFDAGSGVWMSICASIILLIGSIVDMCKKYIG